MVEIPDSVIGEIAGIFSDFYTHADLERLFRVGGGVSVNDFSGNKSKKIMHGLDKINENARIGSGTEPLAALGKILEKYMDAILPIAKEDILGSPDETVIAANKQRCENRKRIQKALSNKELIYQHGGIVASSVAQQPVLTLAEQIKNQGFHAVQKELERAEENLRSGDYAVVMKDAGSLLEAVYKAYLDKNGQPYYDKDTADSLLKKVEKHIETRLKRQSDAAWDAMRSSFYQIAKNIAQLRNTYGGHGANEAQYKIAQELTRGQAQMVLNAAAMLSFYILEA